MKYHVISYIGLDPINTMPTRCVGYTSNPTIAAHFLNQLMQNNGLFQAPVHDEILYSDNVSMEDMKKDPFFDKGLDELQWFRSKSESEVALITTDRLMDRLTEVENLRHGNRYYMGQLEQVNNFPYLQFVKHSKQSDMVQVFYDIRELIELFCQYGFFGFQLDTTTFLLSFDYMDMVSTYVHFRNYVGIRR